MSRPSSFSVLCLIFGLSISSAWAAPVVEAARPEGRARDSRDRDKTEHGETGHEVDHRYSDEQLERIGRGDKERETKHLSDSIDILRAADPRNSAEPVRERPGVEGRNDAIARPAEKAFDDLAVTPQAKPVDEAPAKPRAKTTVDTARAAHASEPVRANPERTTPSLRASSNLKPISDFILRNEFAASRVVEASDVPIVGKLKLTNDLKTGRSVLQIPAADGKSSKVIFDSGTLDAKVRPGRFDSVVTAADGELVIRYRAYAPDHGYREYRYDARAGKWTSSAQTTSIPTAGELLTNYKSGKKTSFGTSGELSVVDYGMNGSMDLVLEENGTRKLVFSSFDVERNGLTRIRDFSVSPDGKSVAVQTYRDGSLDRFDLRVYDRTTGRLSSAVLHSTSTEIGWSDNSHLAVGHYDPATTGRQFALADVHTGQETPINGMLEGAEDGMNLFQVYNGESKQWQHILFAAPDAGGESVGLSVPDGKLIGRVGRKAIYAAGAHEGDFESVISIDLDAKKGTQILGGVRGFHLDDAVILDGTVVVKIKNGADRGRVLFDADGNQMAGFMIPECCSLSSLKWKVRGKVLDLSFISAVNSVDVEYDVAAGTFSKPGYEKEAMTRDGHEYVSDVVNVKSADGTQVPVRLTHLKDLPHNGTGAAFISVYGGFGRGSSGFTPAFDRMQYRFLRDGGTLVGPAPRGGDEFGDAWHQAAIKTKKVKTYEDVIAAANYVIEQGIAPGKRIILTGTSNGGLSTAATALKAPDSFGLAIPVSGVLDLAHAESLDPEFDGWKREYGSSANSAEAANLDKLSPVQTVESWDSSKPMPQFLVVSGSKDSRVNPIHSQNFVAALQAKDPGAVQQLVLKNSGHWNESPGYEKANGWRSKSIVWSKIYDFLGWTFEDTQPQH